MYFYRSFGQYNPEIHTFNAFEKGLEIIEELAVEEASNPEGLREVQEILAKFQRYVEENDLKSAKLLEGRFSEVWAILDKVSFKVDKVGVEALGPGEGEGDGIAANAEAQRDIQIHHLGGVIHQSVSAHWGKQMDLEDRDESDSSYFWERISIIMEGKEYHIYGRLAKEFYDQWVRKGAQGDFQTFIQKAFAQKQSDPLNKISTIFLTNYLSSAELARTKVTFGEDGKLYSIGLLAPEGAELVRMSDSFLAFVVGGDDEMYAAHKGKIKDERGKTQYVISHSSFMRGGGVKTAGEMVLNDGKIEKLSLESGHYKPGLKEIISLFKYLLEKLGRERFRRLNIEILNMLNLIFVEEIKEESFKVAMRNLLYLKKTMWGEDCVKDPVVMLEWLEECLAAKTEGKAAPRPYLSTLELAKTKVWFGEDGIMRVVGLLARDGAKPRAINEQGWVAFVIGKEGEMYAAPMGEIGDGRGTWCTIDQSSFIRGDDVKAAGLMFIQEGVIHDLLGQMVLTAEDSDHYEPDLEKAVNLLKFFMEKFGEEKFRTMQIEMLRQLYDIFEEEIKEKPFEDAVRNLFDIDHRGRGYAKDQVQLLVWLEECLAAKAEGRVLPNAPEVFKRP